jgi:hypothetical protein
MDFLTQVLPRERRQGILAARRTHAAIRESVRRFRPWFFEDEAEAFLDHGAQWRAGLASMALGPVQ